MILNTSTNMDNDIADNFTLVHKTSGIQVFKSKNSNENIIRVQSNSDTIEPENMFTYRINAMTSAHDVLSELDLTDPLDTEDFVMVQVPDMIVDRLQVNGRPSISHTKVTSYFTFTSDPEFVPLSGPNRPSGPDGLTEAIVTQVANSIYKMNQAGIFHCNLTLSDIYTDGTTFKFRNFEFAYLKEHGYPFVGDILTFRKLLGPKYYDTIGKVLLSTFSDDLPDIIVSNTLASDQVLDNLTDIIFGKQTRNSFKPPLLSAGAVAGLTTLAGTIVGGTIAKFQGLALEKNSSTLVPISNANASSTKASASAKGIPKKIHQVWLGTKKVPDETETWKKFCAKHNWDYKLWTDSDLPGFGLTNQADFDRPNISYPQKADIFRYEIIYRHGGLYIDCDMVWLGNDLSDYIRFDSNDFIGVASISQTAQTRMEWPWIENGFFASTAGHTILKDVIEALPKKKQVSNAFFNTGPALLNENIHQPILIIPGPWIFPTKFYIPKFEKEDNPEQYKDVALVLTNSGFSYGLTKTEAFGKLIRG